MRVFSAALSLALALGSPRSPFVAGENLKGSIDGSRRGRDRKPPSLSGNTYAVAAQVGANFAFFVGTWTFDDADEITGGGRMNFPNFQDPSSGFRSLFDQTISGTIDEFDANGTGMMTPVIATPAVGQSNAQPSQFQVTGREFRRAGRPEEGFVASTVQVASQAPGINGGRIEFKLTRRTKDGFDNSSLKGRYAAVCESGTLTGFASGIIDFDGEGGLSGALTLNDQNPEDPVTGARVIVDTGIAGEYAVQDNGSVEISLTYEADGFESGPSPFVITTANRILRATGLAGSFAAVSPVNGGLVRCELDFLTPAFRDGDDEMTME